MSNFSELTYKDLAERLVHYLSSALVSAQYSMTDETMHDALGLCDQVTQRKAAPVPPAGDVEVLRVVSDKQCPIVRKNVGSALDLHAGPNCMHCEGTGFVVKYVDRAHVTRLRAERDGLEVEVTHYLQQMEQMQSELTKARELFREVWEFSDRLPDDLCDRIHASLAQSTPAAKDGESGEPLCLLCLDKKTVLGPKHGDFVRDCPECCGEEG